MRDDRDGLVKIRFVLEQDEIGWPPAATEGVWARPLGTDVYELDNVPWFACGFACGDHVRAEKDSDDVLVVRERTAWSGRYTIRVIPDGAGTPESQVQDVIDTFAPLGADCEGALPAFKLVALDIPPTAQLAEIKGLLVEGEAAGRWGGGVCR